MGDKANVNLLCGAIIEQAVADFRELKRRGKESMGKGRDGTYSIRELERFFLGGTCDRLLGTMNIDLNGAEILRQLHTETT